MEVETQGNSVLTPSKRGPPPIIERFNFTKYESLDDQMTPPITPATPISPKEYEIQIIQPEEDKEAVLDFLREFFFKDEPLNDYLELINDENKTCQELEDFSTKELDNMLNLKAVHNGKIIGVCLNGILHRGFLDDDSGDLNIKHPKFNKIVRLLDYVAKEANVFAKFPNAEKAVTVKILSVNGAYRGQGIAKELINRTREIAKQAGASFITVDCSSHFTALAVKKLGFQLHYSINYADYKDNDGNVVFKPAFPHETVRVYLQEI